MIKFKQLVSKKEKQEVESIMSDLLDTYSDFYLTKNNLRLFIKENTHLLYDSLKKGDKIAYSEHDGIALITGWSDRAPRKYVKILSKDVNSANRLLKIIAWNVNCDMWIKIKKNNPIKNILPTNNFKFAGNRGKEILFVRKYIKPEGVKYVRNYKRED